MNFWNLYSKIYDVLNNLIPYQDHINFLCSLLRVERGGLYLDAGCGTGNFTEKITSLGGVVIGIDKSESMIKVAQKKNRNAQFLISDLSKKLNFEDNTFDGVISNNVISYIAKPKDILLEVNRVLKPGAYCVIATLREGWDPAAVFMEHLKSKGVLSVLIIFFPLLILGFFNLIISIDIKSGHYKTYDEKSLCYLLKESGFSKIEKFISYADQVVVAVCVK